MNPRRPTPSGPKPDPFDHARAPPQAVREAFTANIRIIKRGI